MKVNMIIGLVVWFSLLLGIATLSMQIGCYKGQGPKLTCNPAQYGCVPKILPPEPPKATYERH